MGSPTSRSSLAQLRQPEAAISQEGLLLTTYYYYLYYYLYAAAISEEGFWQLERAYRVYFRGYFMR